MVAGTSAVCCDNFQQGGLFGGNKPGFGQTAPSTGFGTQTQQTQQQAGLFGKPTGTTGTSFGFGQTTPTGFGKYS